MPTILVTFDLEDAQTENYDRAYDALAELGLFRCSPNRLLHLPESTVLGDTTVSSDAATLRDTLKAALGKASGKRVSRIAIGVVSSWAVSGERDDITNLKEVAAYVVGRTL